MDLSRVTEKGAQCLLCPHHCDLAAGQLGLCRARRCEADKVIDDNYGRVTALALDPIEKKPLARFMPGSQVLSVGSYGCNLKCPFCQNSSIACAGPSDVRWRDIEPEALVAQAAELKGLGNIGIAYTYNEPLVGYEYVLDTAKLAHAQGLKNVLVSNGMICTEPLEALAPYLDAANIDLKGFSQEFYDGVGGDFETVKSTIAHLAKAPNCHLEVTCLVIPSLNDSPEEMEALSAWIASLDPEIVLHITRFFPNHRMTDRPPTPVDTIYQLVKTAQTHLKYVYAGNC